MEVLVLVTPVLKVWRESWSLLTREVGVQDKKAWSEISLARIVLFTCWMFLKTRQSILSSDGWMNNALSIMK